MKFDISRDLGRGVCYCGHTGDGKNSQHQDRVQYGHGPCTVKDCGCPQFTWYRWTPYGEEIVRDYLASKASEEA